MKFRGMFIWLFAMVLAAMSLMGCNTMRGAGLDLQEGGKALQNAADR